MLSGTVASMSSRTDLNPTKRAISSASSLDAELCLRSNVSNGPKDSTEICLEKILLKDWELLLFFNAAETTFTLPLFVKEEADPMVFVENNDVDDAAPPKEEVDAEAGCANARRRSAETPRRDMMLIKERVSEKESKLGDQCFLFLESARVYFM